jgi:hypothetical protein
VRGRHLTAVPGSLSIAGKAGTNRIRFTGRLDGHALRPGRYRLTVTARPTGRTGGAAAAVVHRTAQIVA